MSDNPHQPLVELSHIRVEFQQHVALHDISLSVRRGEIITLIGPNGAGKSTLVRVVLGLLTPQQGKIRRQPKLRIGYMPQKVSIDGILPLTVERFLWLSGESQAAKITQVLTEVGAIQVRQRPIQQISGGEMQRVLLARALLRAPDLLVLDEPIQGVDINGQYELYHLIAQIRDQHHCGILMVSHDLHLVMSATDYVICLNQQVCCSGHPAAVSQNPAYLALFGGKVANDLAIYTHHHHPN
jgi:zinc transport system ATP-binding protein